MTKRIVAGCLAIATATAVSATLASPAVAGTCERTIGIQPQVSVGEGAGALTFAVYSTGCAAAGTVAFRAYPGTAQTPADFRPEAGHLRWEAGDATGRTITVRLNADGAVESAIEDLAVVLAEASPGLRVVRATGQGRILDDDVDLLVAVDDVDCPDPQLPMVDVGGGSIMCDALVLASAASTVPVTVRWSTVNGTALAGVDFVAVADEKLDLPAGRTWVRIPIRYLTRSPDAASRWFSIRLTATSAGTIVDPEAVITLGGA